MSSEDLRQAELDDIFAPALRFGDLPIDHVALERLGAGAGLEARLARKVSDAAGVLAVCGPSGGGKSSVIATVLADLASDPGRDESPNGPGGRHLLPLRIPVAPSGEGAADPGSFGRLAISEIHRTATELLTGEHARRLEEAAASQISRRRAAAGSRFHFDLAPLPGFKAGVAAELAGATTELLRDVSASAVLGGLDALIDMLRAHDREPVLVIEDTDQWSRRADGDDIADAFFGRIVHALAREIDACAVIAVQDRYTERASFREMRDFVWAMDLPLIADPVAGLRVIICDRIERYLGGAGDTSRVVETDALAALADVYRRSRNLRRTLRVLRDAIELAGPDFPPALSFDHVVAGIDE